MKNKLIENIISLATIKGLEYLLAFITFPYLVRVLEVEKYGLLVFAQSIMQYFMLFTDYGFNLLGPREIAQHDIKQERGKLFSNILAAKLLLLILSTAVFSVILLCVNMYKNTDIAIYLVVYLMVIGNVLFPIWFFQGIQQMRYITVVNIIARAFSVLGIFIFVQGREDYLVAALCQAIVPLIAAVCSWLILLKCYPEVFVLPDWPGARKLFKDGWNIFFSTIAINLYTASNIVFLGMLTNNVVVGYFSGAKKIIDNLTQLMSPVTQAIYPYVSKKAAASKNEAVRFLRKIVIFLGGGNLAISLSIFIFANDIVKILLGDGYEESVLLLRIMSALPFLIAMSNIFGIQTMLTFGMQKQFSRIIGMAAVVNTVIVLPAIYYYADVGVSATIVGTECFVTMSMWYVLKKCGINLLKRINL